MRSKQARWVQVTPRTGILIRCMESGQRSEMGTGHGSSPSETGSKTSWVMSEKEAEYSKGGELRRMEDAIMSGVRVRMARTTNW